MSPGAMDVDGDSVTYSFDWTYDDGQGGSGTALSSWLGTTVYAYDTVLAGETLRDETWTCAVTPNDGIEDGVAGVDSMLVDDLCLSTTTAQGMTFVQICGGTFDMGCTAAQQSYGCRSDEIPVHSVTLTRDFYLGETEVTQGQWDVLMGNNPSQINNGTCPDCPVEYINWWETLAFANAVSTAEGVDECYTLSGCTGTAGVNLNCSSVTINSTFGSPYDCAGYRLPTEAEWEYAARAGTDLLYSGSAIIDDVGWYSSNSGGTTHVVKGLAPNAWDLYDMSGNVFEWTWDWYGSSYFTSSPSTDPLGPGSGSGIVVRGGSQGYADSYARVTRRYNAGGPSSRWSTFGFRLSRTASNVIDSDSDSDGYPAWQDCDDNDPSVHDPDGSTENCAGIDCWSLLDAGYATGDGTYWIDPDGTGAFEAYCDMTTEEVYSNCSLPATYSRITHSQGNIDFMAVAYEPHGDYALVLGYPSELYRYDPVAQTLDHVATGGGDYWNAIEFAPDGSYALIGGADGYSSPDPVLYVYTAAAGLSQVTGITSGGLYTPSRIGAIAHRPGTDSFAILSDNTGSWPSQVTYIHEFTPDFSSGTHSWIYGGGQVSNQSSSSLAWGENLGQQIALGTDYYLELFYYDPSLSTGNFSTLSTNTGNLKKVIFNPDGTVAWVLQWSSNGKIYTWEGTLRTDYDNTYDFSGYTIWDFTISPDGHWKVFVGRYGNIYWSDSAWRPVDHSAFTQQGIANFDQPPYSATTNDYLHSVAWRPDTCKGLMVGDATSSQGTLILFELQ
jgi:formylglycine-generating enzyme required for sulfatase activity